MDAFVTVLVVESALIDCKTDFQQTITLLQVNTYPIVDLFFLKSPTLLESTKPVIDVSKHDAQPCANLQKP